MVDEVYIKQKKMMETGLELADLLKEILLVSDHQHLHELFAANEYGEALYFIDWMIENEKPDWNDEISKKIEEVKSLNLEIHKLFNRD